MICFRAATVPGGERAHPERGRNCESDRSKCVPEFFIYGGELFTWVGIARRGWGLRLRERGTKGGGWCLVKMEATESSRAPESGWLRPCVLEDDAWVSVFAAPVCPLLQLSFCCCCVVFALRCPVVLPSLRRFRAAMLCDDELC